MQENNYALPEACASVDPLMCMVIKIIKRYNLRIFLLVAL